MHKLTLWVLPREGDWFKHKEKICDNETERIIARVEFDEWQALYQNQNILAHVTEEQCYSHFV